MSPTDYHYCTYLDYLYPNVNNKDFIKKLSSHREFDSTKYDYNGTILYNVQHFMVPSLWYTNTN